MICSHYGKFRARKPLGLRENFCNVLMSEIVFNFCTQKQVVQRLRTEVETLKAESANGSKVSVASLLGLNNNNHIINNNEANGESTDSKDLKNINGLDSIIKKEDYEEEIRNTDDSSPSQENDCSK